MRSIMQKNLLNVLIFLSTPVCGMELWTNVKQWVIQNPSSERTETHVTPLPVLPSELQTSEIVKQLVNISTTRDQALTLLSNYARVNKAIAVYVKTNRIKLQKILDQKFGLSLTTLASGNYDDPKIKTESLEILQNAILFLDTKGSIIEIQPAEVTVNLLIRVIEGNEQVTPGRLNKFIKLLKISLAEKQYPLSAVILGALDNIYTSKTDIFSNSETRNKFFDVIGLNIKSFGTNKLVTQILKLAINKAIKIYGPSLVNTSGVFEYEGSRVTSKTLLEWAKLYGNQEAIKYFESIKKLN